MNPTRQSQPSLGKLKRQATRAWLESAPLHETFIVLNALHAHDSDLISGDHLAIAVQRLLKAEQQPGGPYSDDGELDLLTNAAIAHFAGWAAGPLEPTIAYIKQRIIDDPCVSKITYHQLSGVPGLRDKLSVAVSCDDETLTETGRLGADFYAATLKKSGAERNADIMYSHLNDEIFSRVELELNVYGEEISKLGLEMLEKIRRANRNYEITLLSAYFADSLTYPSDQSAVVTQLGAANLYCWIAYMLYDAMLDDKRDTSALPLANIAHRKSLELYRSVCSDPNMRNFVDYAFDAMDATNAWEVYNTHREPGKIPESMPIFGNLYRLSHRSYAHVLGPLIIASRVHDITSDAKQLLHDSLMQYLIARQLNDDCHDWQEDLRAGRITHVVMTLIKHVYGRKLPVGEKANIKELQKVFWERCGEEMSHEIQKHIQQAKAMLLKSMLVTEESHFMKLYDDIDRSAIASRTLKKRGTAFIKHVTKVIH